MTREDIIRMAHEVGFSVLMPSDDVLNVGGVYPGYDDEISKELQHFAQLVATAEREACAKLCEEGGKDASGRIHVQAWGAAKAIRARGNI